ncbi:hypothetical protein [Alterisphingorhabdus coralli]|uniref:Uncharacterized protein n=1 Tax=Alterisphingorhabdus coralli TaxID=3071408 RepID=A0AA97F7S8_9SPHN|nr:hypothetical protein [Parasphingorhabdus sp. SCSIO 66989]WOE74095.1 hypothetical protein RB602_09520 [Parasphingorhabdus sp. SCSIO 66989]
MRLVYLLLLFLILGACDDTSPATEMIDPKQDSQLKGAAKSTSNMAQQGFDAMACNRDGEAFFEHVWTRGGVGINRQATLTACNAKTKISALYETEATEVSFVLSREGCQGDIKVQVNTEGVSASRFGNSWQQLDDSLHSGWNKFSANCNLSEEEEQVDFGWFRPGFQHIIETLEQQRTLNGITDL